MAIALRTDFDAPGYRKLSTRPRHHAQDQDQDQDQDAFEASKRDFVAELDKVRASLPRGTRIKIGLQDEVRIGHKNKITRRWSKRGALPSAPHDQRTKSGYIFGAICPQEGKPVLSASKGPPASPCRPATPTL